MAIFNSYVKLPEGNVVAIVIECNQPWILTSRYPARLTEEVSLKKLLQAACQERLPVTHSEETAQKDAKRASTL